VRRSFQPGRYALLAIATIATFGCTSIAGPWFTPTPPDPASKVYPSVASGCRCPVAPSAAQWFERVLIVVLENQDYANAMNDGYLRELAKQGANFTNFHGLFHPSYSNYLAMVAGKDIPTVFDGQKDLNACTVGDLLQAKGLTWKNYAQGYPDQPGQCVTAHSFGRYARKHVPFMSFEPVQQHACGNVVAAGRFEIDREKRALPAYAFYSPDLDNDGHDTGLVHASNWLKGFLDPLLTDPAFMKGTLIVVTFDESADQTAAAGNHIYTVFLGPTVKQGEVADNYNHYNVLRTVEENFGLCALGNGDGGARPIVDVWR
jgi:Phosphoesterase family